MRYLLLASVLVMGCGEVAMLPPVDFRADLSVMGVEVGRPDLVTECTDGILLPVLCRYGYDGFRSVPGQLCEVDSDCTTPVKCTTTPPVAPVTVVGIAAVCDGGRCCTSLTVSEDGLPRDWKDCGTGWSCR